MKRNNPNRLLVFWVALVAIAAAKAALACLKP